MAYKDPAKKNAWQRAEGRSKRYIQRHIEKIGADEYRRRARERYRAKHPQTRPRRKRSREEELVAERRGRAERRHAAIAALGGKCERCGIDKPAVLQFDHRVPIGSKYRYSMSKNKGASDGTAREILQAAQPLERFALLCANCHMEKTRSNGDYLAQSNLPSIDQVMERQLPLFDESVARPVPFGFLSHPGAGDAGDRRARSVGEE
jgi:5-methylcytosine-specific restriction endonuclease McrA